MFRASSGPIYTGIASSKQHVSTLQNQTCKCPGLQARISIWGRCILFPRFYSPSFRITERNTYNAIRPGNYKRDLP